MGDLTEAEIFDCIRTNARLAAEDCDKLAKKPREGITYENLRNELKLIEGACRQASAWRGDTRWLPLGLAMEQAHTAAGDWLRGIKLEGGGRIAIAPRHLHANFTKLAENLRAIASGMEKLRDNKTNRVGLILPDAMPDRGPHRDVSRVGYTRSGLILPPSAGLQ